MEVEAEKQVTKISLHEIEEAVRLCDYLKGFRREELIDKLFDQFGLPKFTFVNHLRLTLEEILQKSIITQLPSLVRAFTSLVRGFFTVRIPLDFQFFLDFLDENCDNRLCMENAVNHPILLNKEQRISYRSEFQLMCEDLKLSEYDHFYIIRTLQHVIRCRNASHCWTDTLNQRHPPSKTEDWIQLAFKDCKCTETYTDDAMSFVRFCSHNNLHK
ncbi:uncharacterized protein LOC112195965 isoform X2 [Rosa chinensis]|nr:uncharacterized protein LOC112195965 isoform X2 [Rosa chinensis]